MKQHEVISIEEYLNKRRAQKDAQDQKDKAKEKEARDSKEAINIAYYDIARFEASFS